jgi:hypothetical protein
MHGETRRRQIAATYEARYQLHARVLRRLAAPRVRKQASDQPRGRSVIGRRSQDRRRQLQRSFVGTFEARSVRAIQR